MDSPAVLRIGAGIRAGAGDRAARKADLRALKFTSAFCRFDSIPAHGKTLTTDRDTIPVDGKIVFINKGTAPLCIEVNKRTDVMVKAVFVERHGIMGRVQEEFCHNSPRKELLKGEPVIKETMGVMSGSGAKEREYREVIFRIRGSEHIQVIAKVIAFPVRIPAEVTVRLAVKTIASAVADTVFETFTGTFFTFFSSSIDRSTVTSESKIHEVDKAILNRMVKEKGTEDFIKEPAGFHVLWRLLFEQVKKIFYGDLFDRRGFLSFLIRFFRFFLRRMQRVGKVILIGKPQAGLEIVKSASTRGVANVKTGEDGMEMVLFEVSGPFSIGNNFKFNGKKNGAEHIGREPWGGPEIRITASH